MDVLLCGRFSRAEALAWMQALAAAWPEGRVLGPREARADAARIRAALVARPEPDALQGWPELALIQSLWAGVDHLLSDPTIPAEVPLARMVDPSMSAAMAESVLWAVLALQRGFFAYARQQRDGRWRPLPQRRADDLSVRVLGAGAMGGAAAAALARQGYRVATWGSRGGPLGAALAGADVVVNLLPLTPATTGLLDAGAFAALNCGAGIVNFGRGEHVVDADLLAALACGQVGDAILDVFVSEPLPPGHRYWSHPQVTMLPHVAAITDPRSAAIVAAGNLRALAAGRPLTNLVDRARGY